MTFSVIIPLYNKEAEIERALRSVLGQTLVPLEVVVVDDGSTDDSAAVVERVITEAGAGAVTWAGAQPGADGLPLIKLVRQPNAGVSVARNRGMAEAAGDCFALLDADDEWRPRFLEAVAALMEEYAGAGIYCTGFDVMRGGKQMPGRTPAEKGFVEDYFGESMSRFVATASSSVLPRAVVAEVGGFPEGMALGEDQYMWTKIAVRYPVVFTPERLAVVHASAANRSAAIYTPEKTTYSFRDFWGGFGSATASAVAVATSSGCLLAGASNPLLGEYIARVELGKAITATVRGADEEGRRAERDFAYCRRSRHNRLIWHRLWLLNRLPRSWRSGIHALYVNLAWRLAGKGV